MPARARVCVWGGGGSRWITERYEIYGFIYLRCLVSAVVIITFNFIVIDIACIRFRFDHDRENLQYKKPLISHAQINIPDIPIMLPVSGMNDEGDVNTDNRKG